MAKTLAGVAYRSGGENITSRLALFSRMAAGWRHRLCSRSKLPVYGAAAWRISISSPRRLCCQRGGGAAAYRRRTMRRGAASAQNNGAINGGVCSLAYFSARRNRRGCRLRQLNSYGPIYCIRRRRNGKRSPRQPHMKMLYYLCTTACNLPAADICGAKAA
jgi:hypothetical protein